MRDEYEIKKDNTMFQIERQILLLHIDCDVVASPWDYFKTIEWYSKEYGVDKEDLEVKPVDIKHECLMIPVAEEDEDYENLSYLYYIDGFKELILNDYNEKKDNIILHEGELHRFITFEDYCIASFEHGRSMKKPEIVASTEY